MAYNVKRIVILGHTGFIGGHLKQHFEASHPSLEVRGLSSKELDLTNRQACTALASHVDAHTAVIMCSGIKSNFGSNLENYVKNVAMAENLGRVLASCPLSHLIFLSSIAVYGVDKHDLAITEETPITADTYYGLSKYVSEVLLQLQFAAKRDTNLVILRISSVCGPKENIVAPTPSGFLATYLRGGEVTLWGDGSERREFLFVDDLASVIDRLLHGNFTGVLNVSSGAQVSYRDALDVITRLLDKEVVVRHRERTKPQVDKLYDISRLRTAMPGLRFTSLEDGLRRILESYHQTA